MSAIELSGSATLHLGDCRAVLRTLDADSIDSIVTDPPYGLGFMGKGWDHAVPGVEFWTEMLRVAKPGAYLLAFGGTRTFHRMVCAIEDAGWEIRDTIMWIYGSGFPKSHNGPWGGTALKPAHEPIIMARKPLGTIKTNVRNMVESGLRDRGVTGEIRWIKESASGARKRKAALNSGSTKHSEPLETSARNAERSETPKTGQPTPNSSATGGTNGQHEIQGEQDSTVGQPIGVCARRYSSHTADSAHAAASKSPCSSQSTTSTVVEQLIEKPYTEKSTQSCDEPGFLPGIECFAGIATGLTGSLEHVRISRHDDGTFIWPNGLPEFVPSSPLTVAANVLAYGTGGLNIDLCRIEGPKGECTRGAGGQNGRYGPIGAQGFIADDGRGRWPANVIHDGSEEVLAAFPQASGAVAPVRGTEASSKTAHAFGEFGGRAPSDQRDGGGSAARFFYCAKASKRDRDEGLDDFARDTTNDGRKVAADNPYQRGATIRANTHPTVKPTELMRYLCRLVTLPGGLVLDPFTGSGSTGKAALLEGFRFVGIEQDAAYFPIAAARLRAAQPEPEPSPEPGLQADLFAGESA